MSHIREGRPYVQTLLEVLPGAEEAIALEPEELAGVILTLLVSYEGNRQHAGHFHLGRFVEYSMSRNFRMNDVHPFGDAIAEAWGFLLAEGLIAPDPRRTEETIVTRRGRAAGASKEAYAKYRKASSFPRDILHPVIAEKAWPHLVRGDFDTAVFQAFKELEVAVRQASGADDTDIGTDLMRRAFHAVDGPLTDSKTAKAEREATAHLFAGAVGLFKNPQSHRHVALDDPNETAEMLFIASYLLRIVDSRRG
jgi:uncharacterized protein (TIGR02391 family)